MWLGGSTSIPPQRPPRLSTPIVAGGLLLSCLLLLADAGGSGLKIRGEVAGESRWTGALMKLRIDSIVSVRIRRTGRRIRFSIKVPIENSAFRASILVLLSRLARSTSED